MKTVKSIFSKIFMTSLILGCVLVMPTWAAVSNGCEDENNDYIVPSLALCSTHVYNVGQIANPSYESRTLMQDVIALKTTVIAQQMYKQYEYLEAMVRRLKTQLEKATLTASLQAAGATSDSSSGGSSSSWRDTDKSVYMSVGVTNCMNIFDPEKKLDCYESNFQSIYSQSGNGNKTTAEIRQQLVNDLTALSTTPFHDGDKECVIKEGSCKDVAKIKTNSSSKVFQSCLNDFRTCLFQKRQSYLNNQRKLEAK